MTTHRRRDRLAALEAARQPKPVDYDCPRAGEDVAAFWARLADRCRRHGLHWVLVDDDDRIPLVLVAGFPIADPRTAGGTA